MRQQLPVYSPLNAAAIRRAFLSGFTPGANGQPRFRAALEQDFGADAAVLFASGTQALQVALRLAMRAVRNTRVALPAFTCFDVASAAVGAAARVSCYDIDPATLGPDLASLERLLERGIRVVVIAPLYGFPVDWDAMTALLECSGAIAVEDAAQGNRAEWRGRPLGSLGPISVLSFGRGKGWSGGSGGALLVRDQGPWRGLRDAVANMPALPSRRWPEARAVAGLAAQWTLGRPALYALPHALPWLRLGETIYRPPVAPRPMTRAASACLATLRQQAANEGDTRRATAEAILAELNENESVRAILPLAGARPGYLRLPLRLSRGLAGFSDPKAMNRLGLAPSYPSVLPAIPEFRPWLDADAPVQEWPGARELVRTLFTLPTHSRVTPVERAELLRHLGRYGSAS